MNKKDRLIEILVSSLGYALRRINQIIDRRDGKHTKQILGRLLAELRLLLAKADSDSESDQFRGLVRTIDNVRTIDDGCGRIKLKLWWFGSKEQSKWVRLDDVKDLLSTIETEYQVEVLVDWDWQGPVDD